MDKFEAKVINAVGKLEKEGKIVGLEDPMAFDTEEELEKKKATWNEIFLRCPDFADYVINVYMNPNGEKTLSKLPSILNKVIDIVADTTAKEIAEEVLSGSAIQ